jgi:hydroxymethylbilane synthase
MPAIRIGTRASALALWQARHVAERLSAASPGLVIELVPLTSRGDELADAPLERMEGTGFFTSTLEQALLAGEIDLAVHSMKDLPTAGTSGLVIAAAPERGPVEDALCARAGLTLERLPEGARIGSSSPRRTAQLRARRADLAFVSLRGNVPTRLERVARGDLDAVILARAGLERLGLLDRATEVFPTDAILPAPAQGALAIQTRDDDDRVIRAAAPLDHPATRRAVEAERAVLRALRGGCSVPVGAFAREVDGEIRLDAGVFDPQSGSAVRTRISGRDPQALGTRVASWLLEHGADRILTGMERVPRLAVGGDR